LANKDFKVKNSIVIPTPLALTEGGTGQTSASNALNALLPVQTDNTSKVLQTNGTSTSWVTLPNGYAKGDTASRPGSPALGDIYSNTETSYIEVYTSSGWSQLGVIPSIPTIGTATDVGTNVAYGSGSVDAAFTPGAGGGLVSSYTAISSPGSITGSASSSPVRVTGLTQGTAYTFTVVATNGYGNSLASSSSSSVTPTSVPQAPTIGSPTVINGISYGSASSVTLGVTANATGGKTISNYKYSIDNSTYTALSPASTTSPLTIPGLTGGISYTIKLKAVNDNGDSSASSASSSITAVTAPNVPTSVSAANVGTSRAYNNGAATVSFSAPADNGGTSITSYTATSSPGGYTATGVSSPLTVAGLQTGTSYTFSVVATNSSGTSLSSDSSNSITATTVPNAPTIGTATLSSNTASVTFTAPANGGSAITGYTVTSSPGSLTGSGSSSPISVASLVNGTSYTFTVTATNANGTSAQSSASNSVAPIAAYTLAQVYNSSTTYTVPSGVSRIAVIMYQGGYNGASGSPGVAYTSGGQGGLGGAGGSAAGFHSYTVTPGQTYAVTVGGAQTSSSFGSLGTSSSISVANGATAAGGAGGASDSGAGSSGATINFSSIPGLTTWQAGGGGGGGGRGAYANDEQVGVSNVFGAGGGAGGSANGGSGGAGGRVGKVSGPGTGNNDGQPTNGSPAGGGGGGGGGGANAAGGAAGGGGGSIGGLGQVLVYERA
jgi:hypothetical protein